MVGVLQHLAHSHVVGSLAGDAGTGAGGTRPFITASAGDAPPTPTPPLAALTGVLGAPAEVGVLRDLRPAAEGGGGMAVAAASGAATPSMDSQPDAGLTDSTLRSSSGVKLRMVASTGMSARR